MTKSITNKEELVGKILPDGNSVETNGTTYNSVNTWINSVLYESAYTVSDLDSDDSVCIVYCIKQIYD